MQISILPPTPTLFAGIESAGNRIREQLNDLSKLSLSEPESDWLLLMHRNPWAPQTNSLCVDLPLVDKRVKVP